MQTGCELAARTQIRAFRIDERVLLVAEGDLPTPGYRVDIQQDHDASSRPSSTYCAASWPGSSRKSSPRSAAPRRSASPPTRPR
jgi:hypothetical protein